MPRQQRLHKPGGLYYLVQCSDDEIFIAHDDYEEFCRILARSHRASRVRVHGFCLLPHSVHLVVEVRDSTASQFLQRVMTLYCQWLRHCGRKPFGHHRHRELLVAPDYLVRLLHYLCWLPVPEDASKPRLHRWHCHPAYAHRSVLTWLVTRDGLRRLSRDSAKARRKYRKLTGQPPPLAVALLFKRGSLYDARVIGGYGDRSEIPRPTS